MKDDDTSFEDLFNIKCAKYVGYETMFNNLGYGNILVYAPTRDGWDNPEEYNPWNNITQLMEVMEKIVAREELFEGDYIDMICDMKEDGVANHLRNIISDILITDDDRREQPEMSQFFDCQFRDFREDGNYIVFGSDESEGCPNKDWWESFKACAKPMPAEDSAEKIGDPASFYWQAVNILREVKHHGFEHFYHTSGNNYILETEGRTHVEELQLFHDTPTGLIQLLAIENDIRSNCNGLYDEVLEQHPIGEWLRDESDTTIESVHQHRKFIIRHCLDKLAEPYESEEKRFNRLCEKIRVAGEYPGCGIDLSTHRPYSDILQLAKIVEKVVTISGTPFELNTQMSGDMQEAMRNYVMINYNAEQFKPLEETP